ncbi:MAG: class II aldolase/adducin family protein [Pseudomonadota bacterium]
MNGWPRAHDSFDDLKALSVQFGADPMHIQGAGGNSSIKSGDVMWIKASGTLLADAVKKDIFVATDLRKIRDALRAHDPIADQPAEFLLPGGSGLRPSIETSLHAVFSQNIVLHSHCIHTLAHAVRQDAKALLASRLGAFNWAFVDYAKPGATLARRVGAVLKPETNVVILGNHGLIVAADSVAEVETLQSQVHAALALPLAPVLRPNLNTLAQIAAGGKYAPTEDLALHQLALDPGRLRQVTAGSLYPDHVIFCGIAVVELMRDQTPEQAMAQAVDTGAPPPVWMLSAEHGALVRCDAAPPARIMMRCLADVMARVPTEARLTYLSSEQDIELLDWDAEKYRQQLNV